MKREDIVISSIEKVNEQVKQLQENTYKKSDRKNRAFDIEYKRAILRNLGWMELYGADLSNASRQHSLNIAYINLSVRQVGNGEGRTEIILRADHAIDVARCLYIRGPAGSGKTTLLKWIAVNAASENFEDNLWQWNYLTPFFIKLRQLTDISQFPQPENFPKYIAPHIHGEMPDGWVHTALRNGEAVVLIDGVDEISRRSDVKKWVEEMANTFDKTRFIVTSRPLAQSDNWEVPKGFTEAELLPMEPSEISLFIENWHEAVKTELQEHNEIEEMDNLSEKLKSTIHKNNNVRSLASTPLLCAMICALHRDKNRQLPSNRLDLYEACTKMLVEERETAREIKIARYPDFTYKEKIILISDLAYYLLNNGWSEIPVARAKDRISRSLLTLRSKRKKTSSQTVINFLIERTGLLREPSLGVLDFAHRTFQEYLAAKKAIDEDEIGLLIKNARDAQWREVIILAAGLANRKQKQELLDSLILQGDYEQENKYWYHLLSIACLETMADVDPEILNEIKGRIEKLIPPRDVSEAISLASAGDLAVSHLEYEKGHSQKLSIITLEHINTPAAIQALITYINMPSEQVTSLLLPTLEKINRDEKGNQLLSNLEIPEIKLLGDRVRIIKYINKIDKITIQNFEGSKIPDLKLLRTRELEIINCRNLETLKGISDIESLKSVTFSSCPQLNLQEISFCAQMENLTLDRLNTSDINDIVTLTNLKKLKLTNLQIRDLSAVIRMANLRNLTIENCTELTDVQALERLLSLRYLKIRNCPQVENINCLSSLKNLQNVELKYSDEAKWAKIKENLDRSLQSKIQNS
ncbi:MAG: NACHT domain-containing protein [Anaerolineales bacterium]|nr:NACHT domain-containing protein [Anaerolineales bacterium]